MIPVRVVGIAADTGMQPVVLLSPLEAGPGPRRFVPVWIGAQEAASIAVAISGEAPPRPLSHDLMHRLLTAVGGVVERVEVTRLEDGVFYAELALTSPRGAVVLDCRPSDAIAIALRVGAPLFMAEAVLAAAGVQEDDAEEPVGQRDERRVEAEVAEFQRFLDDVDPEDFQG